MTRGEWTQIVGMMAANWPHSPPPDESIEKWYSDLADRDAKQVYAAMESFNRDAQPFPPTGGQILARLTELERDDPDHGEAWALMNKARWKWGIYGGPGGVPGEAEPMAWLQERSPAVAEAVRRFGYRELCQVDVTDEQTVRAQFREVFKAVCSERQRDGAYRGLPAAGLRGISGNGPRKLDPRKAIGA